MFFLFLLAWIIFNGNCTLEIVIFGVIFAILMMWFMKKFMNYSIQGEIKLIKRIGILFKLLWILVLEIMKANEHMIYWIFSDKYRMEPVLVTFSVDLKKNWTRALFANFITLTPGTITALLEDNIFTVHCLDRDLAEGIEDCAFLKTLQRLEEE